MTCSVLRYIFKVIFMTVHLSNVDVLIVSKHRLSQSLALSFSPFYGLLKFKKLNSGMEVFRIFPEFRLKK